MSNHRQYVVVRNAEADRGSLSICEVDEYSGDFRKKLSSDYMSMFAWGVGLMNYPWSPKLHIGKDMAVAVDWSHVNMSTKREAVENSDVYVVDETVVSPRNFHHAIKKAMSLHPVCTMIGRDMIQYIRGSLPVERLLLCQLSTDRLISTINDSLEARSLSDAYYLRQDIQRITEVIEEFRRRAEVDEHRIHFLTHELGIVQSQYKHTQAMLQNRLLPDPKGFFRRWNSSAKHARFLGLFMRLLQKDNLSDDEALIVAMGIAVMGVAENVFVEAWVRDFDIRWGDEVGLSKNLLVHKSILGEYESY